MTERGRTMRCARIALVCALVASACRIERVEPAGTATPDEPDLPTLATELLEAQAAAWNAGDLEGFMAAYERSPSTTYIGSAGLIEGFEGIRERYAPLFAPGAARDSLRFESVRARELDPRFAVVTARYVLFRDDVVTSTGPFTLVLMRVEGSWRIVHDQSAEDPPSDP